MGKPDVGNPQVRFDEGEGHGQSGPSLLDWWKFADRELLGGMFSQNSVNQNRTVEFVSMEKRNSRTKLLPG